MSTDAEEIREKIQAAEHRAVDTNLLTLIATQLAAAQAGIAAARQAVELLIREGAPEKQPSKPEVGQVIETLGNGSGRIEA